MFKYIKEFIILSSIKQMMIMTIMSFSLIPFFWGEKMTKMTWSLAGDVLFLAALISRSFPEVWLGINKVYALRVKKAI